MIATLETTIFALLFGAVIQGFLPIASERTALIFVGLATSVIVVHLVMFHFRWQMVPAYLVAAILLIVLAAGVSTASNVKLLSAGGAILLVLASFVLSIGFPVRNLPVPDGPHAVGVVTHDLEYTHSGSGDAPAQLRRLLVRIWYPATVENEQNHTRETLWSEFNDADYFSATERFFAAYLRNIRTHSYRSAPFVADLGSRPLLIYNHALLSTASDNTLLMESLASHGYVIASIQHKDQRAEYASLQNELSTEERAREHEDLKRLGGDLDRSERSALSLQVYQQNPTLPTIVMRRAQDTEYVLENLVSVLSTIPGCDNATCVEQGRVGLLGLSLGGAVATEFCRTNRLCGAAVNMDGGIFGADIQAPVSVPYLMLYSDSNEGGNDFLKAASGESFGDRAIAGARHADFHDASSVIPALRWFGLLGPIGGEEMNRRKNRYVREFLDESL